MAEIETIRVMVSSRSQIAAFRRTRRLREVRERRHAFLASIRWTAVRRVVGHNEPTFDVWIHENETRHAAGRSVLQISQDEINRADIVLVLNTEDAGSVSNNSDICICHTELARAMTKRRCTVFMVHLFLIHEPKSAVETRFQDYVDRLGLFQKEASDERALHVVVVELPQNRAARFVAQGASIGARKLDRGEALEWNRLNLVDRQAEIHKALVRALEGHGLSDVTGHPLFVVSLSRVRCLVRIDAVPAAASKPAASKPAASEPAASEPAAGELVGQPFLRDHVHADRLADGDLAGPLRIVGCHRSIIVSEAWKLLGAPDTMIDSSDFGIYAADHVQKIQLVLVACCSVETATVVAVRRLCEWLSESGEGESLVARAHARSRIPATVAAKRHATPNVALAPKRQKRAPQ